MINFSSMYEVIYIYEIMILANLIMKVRTAAAAMQRPHHHHDHATWPVLAHAKKQ